MFTPVKSYILEDTNNKKFEFIRCGLFFTKVALYYRDVDYGSHCYCSYSLVDIFKTMNEAKIYTRFLT
jgi:hypothetical protein